MKRHLNENLASLLTGVKNTENALLGVSDIIMKHEASSTVDEQFLM